MLPIGYAPWWKPGFRRGHLTHDDALELFERLRAQMFRPVSLGHVSPRDGDGARRDSPTACADRTSSAARRRADHRTRRVARGQRGRRRRDAVARERRQPRISPDSFVGHDRRPGDGSGSRRAVSRAACRDAGAHAIGESVASPVACRSPATRDGLEGSRSRGLGTRSSRGDPLRRARVVHRRGCRRTDHARRSGRVRRRWSPRSWREARALAQPGEFTRRAVLNGKLDILQAEATGDLDRRGVARRSGGRVAPTRWRPDASRGVAARGVDRARGADRLRHRFSGGGRRSDRAGADRFGRPTRSIDALDGLLATARTGELVREGALVVIAGAPNVGKSSLFNALLGRESRDRHGHPGHDARRDRGGRRHADGAAAPRRHGGNSRRRRSGRAARRRGERVVRRARGGRAGVRRRRRVAAPDRRDAGGARPRAPVVVGADEERSRAAVGRGAERTRARRRARRAASR